MSLPQTRNSGQQERTTGGIDLGDRCMDSLGDSAPLALAHSLLIPSIPRNDLHFLTLLTGGMIGPTPEKLGHLTSKHASPAQPLPAGPLPTAQLILGTQSSGL